MDRGEFEEVFREVHDAWGTNKLKRSRPDAFNLPEKRYNSLVEEVWYEDMEDFNTVIEVLESRGYRITKD